MKLATVRTPAGTVAARVEGSDYVEIPGYADLGALLAEDGWQQRAEAADGPRHAADQVELATLVADPSKVLCVGLNYASHIKEMGRDLPDHPTLFAKFSDTLTAPNADVEVPQSDPEVDWEAELVVVIGRTARRVSEADAGQYIAGYAAANDISMRGYQFRTKEWLQGKAFEATTPIGPVMVTPDELDPGAVIRTTVDGQEMQHGTIDDLVHRPEYLVSYISEITTLRPGDLILTGTTGGVGRARKPPVYLKDGQTVTVSIDGIGELRTRMVAQRDVPSVPPAGAAPVAPKEG